MARVSIEVPEQLEFEVELPILISHINRGDHLGNESLVSLLNEARVQFLRSRGVAEWGAQSRQVVNADLAVIYKSEGRYGERLRIALGVGARHRCGYDLLYRVVEADSGRLIALAKTAHLLIDTRTGRPLDAADIHRQLDRGSLDSGGAIP
ncbi:MAG TPA: thioesterase family protein [Spongiibacteraceae bacterium]|jgi:4-hydroxybenzoyl-CoA thioesterase|nr:thioesterase family protein [Spongiibacteraceae bacterium]HUH38132.1 thioesterase family protein [Spongiibacteraceae bacterium]